MAYHVYDEELVSNSIGRKFWIYKNDTFYQQRVGRAGPYQGANLRRLRDLCPNARTIIDVGMNVGMNTIEYATWAKNVHGFEPTPQTYSMALKNIALAKAQKEDDFVKGWYKQGDSWASLLLTGNINTYNVGLGPEKKSTTIVIKPNNAGHNHVNNSDLKRWTGKRWIDRTSKVEYEKIPIQIETLDSYGFNDVDVIKIDVEGFEYDVLLGASKTIEKWHPVVQVEMVEGQPRRFGHSVNDVIKYFDDLGYKMTLADGTILPMEWTFVKGKMDRFFIHESHRSWKSASFKDFNEQPTEVIG